MKRLTDARCREMERRWDLEREAVDLLRTVVFEWDSDPMSVACFDLRLVKRAKAVVKELSETKSAREL